MARETSWGEFMGDCVEGVLGSYYTRVGALLLMASSLAYCSGRNTGFDKGREDQVQRLERFIEANERMVGVHQETIPLLEREILGFQKRFDYGAQAQSAAIKGHEESKKQHAECIPEDLEDIKAAKRVLPVLKQSKFEDYSVW